MAQEAMCAWYQSALDQIKFTGAFFRKIRVSQGLHSKITQVQYFTKNAGGPREVSTGRAAEFWSLNFA